MRLIVYHGIGNNDKTLFKINDGQWKEIYNQVGIQRINKLVDNMTVVKTNIFKSGLAVVYRK